MNNKNTKKTTWANNVNIFVQILKSPNAGTAVKTNAHNELLKLAKIVDDQNG